jgi:hypothetical protein
MAQEPDKNVDYSDGLTVRVKTLCDSCKHRDPFVNPFVCKAFPKGIPKAILLGVYDHRFRWLEPGNKDNGITYEKKEGDTFEDLVEKAKARKK